MDQEKRSEATWVGLFLRDQHGRYIHRDHISSIEVLKIAGELCFCIELNVAAVGIDDTVIWRRIDCSQTLEEAQLELDELMRKAPR